MTWLAEGWAAKAEAAPGPTPRHQLVSNHDAVEEGSLRVNMTAAAARSRGCTLAKVLALFGLACVKLSDLSLSTYVPEFEVSPAHWPLNLLVNCQGKLFLCACSVLAVLQAAWLASGSRRSWVIH